jgi:hypothetical protein
LIGSSKAARYHVVPAGQAMADRRQICLVSPAIEGFPAAWLQPALIIGRQCCGAANFLA